MDYKQKYEEAFERAKKWYYAPNADKIPTYANRVIKEIFPELKESEDERIRKEIVDFINRVYERQALIITDDERDNWIAWLEKQGEKESEDEIIPDKNETRDIEQNLADKDEKIRKAIIALLHFALANGSAVAPGHNVTKEQALAWLKKQETSYTKKDVDIAYIKGINDARNEIEKQYEATYQIRKDIATFIFNYRGDIKDRAKWMDYLGIKVYVFEREDEKPQGKTALEAITEEKVDNANRVEPKFKIGDWITCEGFNTGKILSIEGDNYEVEILDGNRVFSNIDYIDKIFHLWSIEDAKPGDVLASKDGNNILIFRNLDTATSFSSYYNLRGKGELGWSNKSFIPAIKEQRDLLFKKMKEAGYEWDIDEKELKKVISESMFKIGDWITVDNPCQIISINDNGNYIVQYCDDERTYVRSKNFCESHFHLWTIADAKPGDVLAAHECYVMFKEIDGLNIKCYCTYHYMNNPSLHVDTLQNKDAFHPATKEQRDTLIKAMADDGWKFDFDKKELSKIHVIDEGKAEIDYCFTKMMNGEKVSSAWGEEDEDMCYKATAVINKLCAEGREFVWSVNTLKKLLYWLKSLKQRIIG